MSSCTGCVRCQTSPRWLLVSQLISQIILKAMQFGVQLNFLPSNSLQARLHPHVFGQSPFVWATGLSEDQRRPILANMWASLCGKKQAFFFSPAVYKAWSLQLIQGLPWIQTLKPQIHISCQSGRYCRYAVLLSVCVLFSVIYCRCENRKPRVTEAVQMWIHDKVFHLKCLMIWGPAGI